MPKTEIDASKSYPITVAGEILASARGIDASRAMKDVRGRLRANWSNVVTLDPSILKSKSHANDGNRWPTVSGAVILYVCDRTKRDALMAGAKKRATKRTKRAKVTNDAPAQ